MLRVPGYELRVVGYGLQPAAALKPETSISDNVLSDKKR